MDKTGEKAESALPELPAALSPKQKARYRVIADIARRTADRLPHSPDKSVEPAHVLDLHRAVLFRRE